jgi:FixJ family two-component response regulator
MVNDVTAARGSGHLIADMQFHVVTQDVGRRTALVAALRTAGARAQGHADLAAAAQGLSELFDNILLLEDPRLALEDPGHGPAALAAAFDALPLRQRDSAHIIVGLDGHCPELVVDLLRGGAADVVSRGGEPVLIAARLIATGRRLVEAHAKARRSDSECASIDQLSPRERDVLARLASGDRTKQIAHALHLSPRTVEMHCARLRRRLGVNSLGQAVGLWMQAQARPAERIA